MKREYEIQPVRYHDEEGTQVCAPEDADAWGVYERLPPDGHGHRLAFWIVDLATEDRAKECVRALLQLHSLGLAVRVIPEATA